MDYVFDKDLYVCTCKALRLEYFPCHDGKTDCSKCGYAELKKIDISEIDSQ